MEFSGWEKLSLVDFDDNLTTTLFTAGCNFRCPFCHNGGLVLHPNDNPQIPWELILDYLKRRKKELDAVCVTGGEPTLMPDLEDKLRDIKSLGYLVKLDTNGTHPALMKKLYEEGLVDYFAMDIKNAKAKYPLTSGIPNLDLSPIEESVHWLLTSGARFEFRTTIISEFHTEEDMRQIASWIEGAPRYYLQRYIDSEQCIEHGLHMVPKEEAERFLEILKPHVKETGLRSYD